MRFRLAYAPLCLSVLALACFEDPVANTTDGGGTESGDGDGDPTGDGDGDPTGDGDGDATGDGDPTGDGDGDPTGDGDGDPTGDGDGDPGPCADGPYAVTYTGPIMLPAGNNPQGVTIGDVDDDGDLDIIGTARDDHNVNVWLGNGGGTFNGPMATAVPDGVFPGKIRAGAIADGVLDVVIEAYSSNLMATVFVRLRGDGNGGFYDYESFQPESAAFALGLITGDTALDIVSPGPQKMIVYTASIGQESFFPVDASESAAPYNGANNIALGDFDNNDFTDVAATAFGNLYIGDGNGAGEFSFAAPLPFFGGPTDIAVGDVNNDGNLDIVLTTAGGGSDAGHLFRGVGDGTFMPGMEISAPSAPAGVAIADIDLDGFDDVAMVGSGNLAVYLSTGDGFGPAKQIACTGQNPRQLWIGDLNGDCVGDVVTMTDNGVCIMMSEAP